MVVSGCMGECGGVSMYERVWCCQNVRECGGVSCMRECGGVSMYERVWWCQYVWESVVVSVCMRECGVVSM